MAFTKGVWEVDSETGVSAVYLVDPTSPDDRAPFTAPLSNLARLRFHSSLPYLMIAYDETLTIDFPSRTLSGNTVQGDTKFKTYAQEYAFPNHNLGYVPKVLCKRGANLTMYPNTTIQNLLTATSRGTRTAQVEVTATGIFVVERASLETYGAQSGALTAMSETFRVIILKSAVADQSDTFLIDGETGRVMFGRGMIDNTAVGNPLKIVSSGGVFSVPVIGPTIDTIGAGIRLTYPDGSNADYYGYSGTFATTYIQISP